MLRTHRQRVPAMLAVACAGMLVVAVAGASPDGRQLAPAACADAPADSSSCVQPSATTAAKGGSTPTTDKGDKGTTDTTSKDDCKGSTTSSTSKGDKDTTSSTSKGDKDTTSSTAKGDKDSTT